MFINSTSFIGLLYSPNECEDISVKQGSNRSKQAIKQLKRSLKMDNSH